MKKLASLSALLIAICALPMMAQNDSEGWHHGRTRHVLLISIDGMHAVDFLNCAKGTAGVNDGSPYCPNLAALGASGVNYVSASASRPSDSFPGLMTIVSGATPRTLVFQFWLP